MQDTIMKNGKWEFDKDVTEVFDEMLVRSIPDYQNMRDLVVSIGSEFAKQHTSIIDVGCSNGNAIKPFIDKLGARNFYKLYDVSIPMLEECQKRFKGWIDSGLVKIENHDLRNGIKDVNASLVLSILTLQFTPIEYRQKIVKSIYNSLNSGGAFILVEKVLGNTYEIDDLLVSKYYKMKKDNLYTQEQIENKRKSLEGVLVPITANWNIELLREAGFKQIDCFWRNLNFVGFIAIKD
jgi:tRNA (cmo5U34)-methyltransferase